ncbi:hypothetical protein AB0M48_12545 [Lentzea sp. NPDC051208]|uniref:Vgb family protein n=1 Tax=Lentzea sp. NPDC051208 TaxID=3154642 RepID=UPI0034489029
MRTDGRFGKAVNPRSARGSVERLTPPSPLWGSNGIAFGPDGRLYVAQFVAGKISAVDLGNGEVDTVVDMDGPVQAPDDLAFGADGSMYITDLVPGRVWRRSPDGEFTLVAEGVASPNGIACAGNRLFVNEMCMGGRVLELFPGGGEPVVLAEGLAFGNAMQLGPDGYLYYPHMVTNEVHRVSPDGGPAELVARDVHQPVAVRFDLSGELTVLSRGEAGIVTRIDLSSGRRTVVPGDLSGMDNAAFDTENRMFVSSFAAGGIAELTPDGRARVIVPKGLVGPYGVAVDRSGTVYAGDNFRLATVTGGEAHTRELLLSSHGVATDDCGRVHLASQSGVVRTYEPENRSLRTRAENLARPNGVALRSDGVLVVAESGAGRVVGIDGENGLTVLAEGMGFPVDVAVDAEDRCYVSDEQRGVVARIDDGALVPVAEGLDQPQGIAVSAGELFVVETGARRLLAIDLVTGERRVEAEDLAVGLPPGRTRVHPGAGVPVPFAGVAVGPDRTIYVSANGEGSVVRLIR